MGIIEVRKAKRFEHKKPTAVTSTQTMGENLCRKKKRMEMIKKERKGPPESTKSCSLLDNFSSST
jgi:hypothetical protein